MPIYELVCKDCGHEESLMCSWKKRQEATCSQCGSKNLGQKFTSIGVIGSSSSSNQNSGGSRPRGGFT